VDVRDYNKKTEEEEENIDKINRDKQREQTAKE
jgi:hypothetical protein